MRFAFASSLLVLGTVLLACTGDDPNLVPITDTDGGTTGTNPNAITCDASKTCANGAACVDGYCCDSPCGGVCEACNVTGKEGTCSAKAGAPRHGACAGDQSGTCAGSCDGTNGAACTYPTVPCGAAGSCAGGTVTVPAACAAGTCGTARTATCTLGCYQDGCLGVKQIAAGYYHTCAVLTDGKVRCFGSNDSGESGQQGTADVLRPTEVGGITSAVAVAATFGSTCVVLADKTVSCFGSNSSAALGTGTADNNPHYMPQKVPGLANIVGIGGSSGGHYCAIDTAGSLKCWGANGNGQLGGGATSTVAGPTTVCQPNVAGCTASSGATFVAGGDNHTCAVFAGGQVACWGNNGAGECGQTTTGNVLSPTFVSALTATSLIGGNQTTCAVSGGSAKCFGSDGLGVLGRGTSSTAAASTPTPVCTTADCSKLLDKVTSVATYDESACAVSGGAVKCWGTNTGGQLGDGNTSSSQSYAATTAIATNAVAVLSGGGANYAIVDDGANRDLRCWGGESQGQCGTGTEGMARKTPVSPMW